VGIDHVVSLVPSGVFVGIDYAASLGPSEVSAGIDHEASSAPSAPTPVEARGPVVEVPKLLASAPAACEDTVASSSRRPSNHRMASALGSST